MKNEYGDMRNEEAAAATGRSGLRRWIARQGGCVARDFWRARCASVAIESAAVLSILIVVAGGLMEIFSSVYMNETMSRAARAAARAVALNPSAHDDAAAVQALACEAIRRELGLGQDPDCSDAWEVTVDTGLTTGDLLNGESPDTRTGDMVRIHIAWHREPWSFGADPSDADSSDADSSDADSSDADSSDANSSEPAAAIIGGPATGPLEGWTVEPEPVEGAPVEAAPAEPEPRTLQVSIAVARSEPDALTP